MKNIAIFGLEGYTKKLIDDNKQIIRCNNSGNIFTFYMPKEYQSDFNEFEQGIIEGISYGN